MASLFVLLGSMVAAPPGEAAHSRQFAPPSDYWSRPVDRGSGQGGSNEKKGDREGKGDNDNRGKDGRDDAQMRVSLDAAVSMVRSRYEGKVIRAETHWSDGRPVHHVRLLTEEGRVYTVRVDGVSGRTQ